MIWSDDDRVYNIPTGAITMQEEKKPIRKRGRLATALACSILSSFSVMSAAYGAAMCDPVVVKAGDSISQLAKTHLGNMQRYQDIVAATNQAAGADGSYASITDPDRIEIGMKLCIPGNAGDASDAGTRSGDGIVEFTIIQVNDVYEISPVAGGREGGLARLATLKNRLMKENPNTFLFLAGDLVSPSALGTAKVDGKRINGEHIVDVMNEVGMDYATLGNHEFDISEEDFLARLDESTATWVSANVTDKSGQMFPGVTETNTMTITDHDGDEVVVGVLGIMLSNYTSSYANYADPIEAAERHIGSLDEKSDLVIALTHLTMEEDIELAKRVSEIDIIMGG